MATIFESDQYGNVYLVEDTPEVVENKEEKLEYFARKLVQTFGRTSKNFKQIQDEKAQEEFWGDEAEEMKAYKEQSEEDYQTLTQMHL